MRMRSYRRCLVAMLAIALMGAMGWAQQSQQTGNEFQWKGKIAPEGILIIKNVNGDIDAGPAAGDEVEVTAEKRGPKADEVKIEVEELRDGVVICAIYPGWFKRNCGDWHSSNGGNDRTKVHFTVRVPENVRFHGQNVNGDVTAEHLGRFVHASSVNGSIKASTKSWVEADTVNGSIEAKMGSADWHGALTENSVNGSITLELPDDINVEVNFASLNGSLQSDFSFTQSGKLSSHLINGTIGSGGRELKLNTVNGEVRLKRREPI